MVALLPGNQFHFFLGGGHRGAHLSQRGVPPGHPWEPPLVRVRVSGRTIEPSNYRHTIVTVFLRNAEQRFRRSLVNPVMSWVNQ